MVFLYLNTHSVATASVALTALTRRTLKSRKWGMTDPDKIVFISGIPLPAARDIDLPVERPRSPFESWSWSCCFAVGSLALVVIVTVPAMMPKSRAEPMYIPNFPQ